MTDPKLIHYRPTGNPTGEYVPMPTNDELAAMGERERYVWQHASWGIGITVTESQVWHANHEDNCAECRADWKRVDALGAAADRTESARGILAFAISDITHQAIDARERGIDPDTILDAVLKALNLAQGRASRAMNPPKPRKKRGAAK